MDSRFLTIYRSSAGSGKTYTLTREYLRLALGGVKEKVFRKILAVTFTNKAMQEMKDRIVEQLHKFSKGETGSMGEELMRDLEMDAKTFRENACKLLSEILHNYSHFSITTIDAFFQRVIRSFARDLGLAGGYKLELDPELTIHEIVQDLLTHVEEDKVLREWLVRYSLDKLEQGSSWVVDRDLEEFTKNKLLSEEFQDFEQEVKNWPREKIMTLNVEVKSRVAKFRIQMKNLAKEGIRLMDQHGLVARDFFQTSKGPGVYFQKVLDENFDPNSFVRNAVGDDKFTSGKKPVPKVETALDNGLRKIFRDLLDIWDRNEVQYNTDLAILRNIYLLGLTSDIINKMGTYKREHDIMFISDATRLLSDLVEQTDAMFIYERVGSFYDHFLIDEFQDTSRYQWKSFSPLVHNSLSEGKKNLIVGDVKQSIYRWRGGELELLQENVEKQFGAATIRHEQLRKNFRSTPSIIKFNNALFQSIPAVLGGTFNEDSSLSDAATDYLESIYHDVAQEFPVRPDNEEKQQGFVHIELFKGSNDEKWKDLATERLPAIIMELQDKQVPLSEMTILVRTNKEGQLAADTLSKFSRDHPELPYRFTFISNDSLFLSGSAACRLLVAAIRFMNDPADSINRVDLAYHYHKVHRKDTDTLSEIFSSCHYSHSPEPTEPEKKIREIAPWERRPFIEIVEKLIHALGLSGLQDEFTYLQTFQDLVLQFVSKERGDIASFIYWWEEYAGKQSISIPDDLEAIRILTIHKSKGLEFHSVIMPFMKWSVDHDRSPDVWFRAPHLENSPVVPVRYSKILDKTEFAEQYREERLKAFVDNLNMLYVALTRASNDLWIMGPVKSDSSDGSINTILQKTLESSTFALSDKWDKKQRIFNFGERDFTYKAERTEKDVQPVYLEKYTESNWEEELVLKPVTASLIPADRQIKINTGIIIHQLLSKVRYTADFEKVLTAITWEEALSASEVDRIKEMIMTSFRDPRIKEWFSRKWQVINESAILTADNEYRPDRVIMDDREVQVIDYKTGMRNDRDVHQVRNYMEVLAELEGKPARGFLWYIDLNEIAEV